MLSATTSRQSMPKHGSRNSPALDAIEAELACKRGVERDESRWHVKRKRTMCTLFDVGWQTRGYLCQSAGGMTDGIYAQYSSSSASKARWPSGLRRSIKEDILTYGWERKQPCEEGVRTDPIRARSSREDTRANASGELCGRKPDSAKLERQMPIGKRRVRASSSQAQDDVRAFRKMASAEALDQ
ncbi:hypothetical protein L1887_48238 [Cichorium endivia]|nr:hypothetical protein L1887_48238 [Cichorium endivia]